MYVVIEERRVPRDPSEPFGEQVRLHALQLQNVGLDVGGLCHEQVLVLDRPVVPLLAQQNIPLESIAVKVHVRELVLRRRHVLLGGHAKILHGDDVIYLDIRQCPPWHGPAGVHLTEY